MKYASTAFELVASVALLGLLGYWLASGLGLAAGALAGFVLYMVVAYRRMKAENLPTNQDEDDSSE